MNILYTFIVLVHIVQSGPLEQNENYKIRSDEMLASTNLYKKKSPKNEDIKLVPYRLRQYISTTNEETMPDSAKRACDIKFKSNRKMINRIRKIKMENDKHLSSYNNNRNKLIKDYFNWRPCMRMSEDYDDPDIELKQEDKFYTVKDPTIGRYREVYRKRKPAPTNKPITIRTYNPGKLEPKVIKTDFVDEAGLPKRSPKKCKNQEDEGRNNEMHFIPILQFASMNTLTLIPADVIGQQNSNELMDVGVNEDDAGNQTSTTETNKTAYVGDIPPYMEHKTNVQIITEENEGNGEVATSPTQINKINKEKLKNFNQHKGQNQVEVTIDFSGHKKGNKTDQNKTQEFSITIPVTTCPAEQNQSAPNNETNENVQDNMIDVNATSSTAHYYLNMSNSETRNNMTFDALNEMMQCDACNNLETTSTTEMCLSAPSLNRPVEEDDTLLLGPKDFMNPFPNRACKNGRSKMHTTNVNKNPKDSEVVKGYVNNLRNNVIHKIDNYKGIYPDRLSNNNLLKTIDKTNQNKPSGVEFGDDGSGRNDEENDVAERASHAKNNIKKIYYEGNSGHGKVYKEMTYDNHDYLNRMNECREQNVEEIDKSLRTPYKKNMKHTPPFEQTTATRFLDNERKQEQFNEKSADKVIHTPANKMPNTLNDDKISEESEKILFPTIYDADDIYPSEACDAKTATRYEVIDDHLQDHINLEKLKFVVPENKKVSYPYEIENSLTHEHIKDLIESNDDVTPPLASSERRSNVRTSNYQRKIRPIYIVNERAQAIPDYENHIRYKKQHPLSKQARFPNTKSRAIYRDGDMLELIKSEKILQNSKRIDQKTMAEIVDADRKYAEKYMKGPCKEVMKQKEKEKSITGQDVAIHNNKVSRTVYQSLENPDYDAEINMCQGEDFKKDIRLPARICAKGKAKQHDSEDSKRSPEVATKQRPVKFREFHRPVLERDRLEEFRELKSSPDLLEDIYFTYRDNKNDFEKNKVPLSTIPMMDVEIASPPTSEISPYRYEEEPIVSERNIFLKEVPMQKIIRYENRDLIRDSEEPRYTQVMVFQNLEDDEQSKNVPVKKAPVLHARLHERHNARVKGLRGKKRNEKKNLDRRCDNSTIGYLVVTEVDDCSLENMNRSPCPKSDNEEEPCSNNSEEQSSGGSKKTKYNVTTYLIKDDPLHPNKPNQYEKKEPASNTTCQYSNQSSSPEVNAETFLRLKFKLCDMTERISEIINASVTDKAIIVALLETLLKNFDTIETINNPLDSIQETRDGDELAEATHQHYNNLYVATQLVGRVEKNLKGLVDSLQDLKEDTEMSLEATRTRLSSLKTFLMEQDSELAEMHKKVDMAKCSSNNNKKRKKKKFKIFSWKEE